MKLLTTLLIACLAALAVYAARRRIMFALKTGAVVYIVVLFGRLILSAGSLAASIRRHGLNPWEYFKHLLSELPDRPPNAVLTDLLPDVWARCRAGPVPVAQ